MAKASIMIVEDEAITGKTLEITLKNMGYMVSSVLRTGEHAVKTAGNDRPDIILMDIRLKGQMDGIEAADIIRSRFDIPSIFLTAYADKKKLERAKLVMPSGYIRKPFSDRDLKITIDMGLYAARINHKRLKAEKALQKSHDTLEKRVMERTAELTLANKRLKEQINIRKKVEEELRASKEKFSKIFRMNPIGIIISTLEDGRIIDMNKSAESITGYTSREAVGQIAIDVGFWDNRETRKKMVQRFKASGHIRDFKFEFKHKSGQPHMGLYSQEPIHIDTIPCVITTMQDITESWTMEQVLEQRHKEMRFLNTILRKATRSLSFREVTASIIEGIKKIIQPDLTILFIKKEDQLVPVQPDSSVTKLFEHTDVHKIGECLCGLAVSSKKPQYSVDIWKDPLCTRQECKSAGYHSFAAFPLFSKKTMIGVLGLASATKRDFKKQAMFLELLADQIAVGIQNSILHKDLKKQEELFRVAAKTSSDLVFERDLSTDCIKWFGDIEGMLGSGVKEKMTTFDQFCQLIHPEDRAGIRKKIEQEYGSKTILSLNFRVKKKDGSYLYWGAKAQNLFNTAGRPVKRVGACTDITKRKTAEDALKKNQHLLQTVFDSISDSLILMAGDMKILMLNKAAMSYYHVTLKEAVNSRCHELLKNTSCPCEGCRLPFAVSDTGPVTFERQGCMDPDRDEQVTTYPVMESSVVNGTLIRIKDITEKKRAETLMARTDRLTSLGQLSGGIAHEIRNPLGGIKLFLDILSDEDQYKRTETEKEILDEINTNINKINGIVKRILAFAKPDGTYSENLDINKVIKETLKLLDNRISKSTMNVNLFFTESLPFVKGDFIGLQQVFTNLILNAVQAMDKKGTLTVGTSLGYTSFYKNRRIIRIEIKDTGPGILPGDQKNIFNPFFTTKSTGTGLGLAISHQIIKQHGGTLLFTSKPGRGTTFVIELPCEVAGGK